GEAAVPDLVIGQVQHLVKRRHPRLRRVEVEAADQPQHLFARRPGEGQGIVAPLALERHGDLVVGQPVEVPGASGGGDFGDVDRVDLVAVDEVLQLAHVALASVSDIGVYPQPVVAPTIPRGAGPASYHILVWQNAREVKRYFRRAARGRRIFAAVGSRFPGRKAVGALHHSPPLATSGRRQGQGPQAGPTACRKSHWPSGPAGASVRPSLASPLPTWAASPIGTRP